jgi:flagellar hook-associated protein 3 FlgL
MRITNTMLVNNMVNYMSNNLTRMDKYQTQLATGKKIQVPSDDPIVAIRALKFRTDVSEVNQHQKNLKDAQSWMDISENTIGSIGDILQRARELAVQGANGTYTPADMNKMKMEVDQLATQTIKLANMTYSGRYIFSGFKTDQPLVDADPSSATYGQFLIVVNNSDEQINFQVGIADSINVNVCGGDLFDNGANASIGSTGGMIDILKQLSADLGSGNHAGVRNDIGGIDTQMYNLLKVRADIGARQNRLELTSDRLSNDNINFTQLMADNEDVDTAETIMNLKNEENVYRASLSGGARIIQPTLVDFLR